MFWGLIMEPQRRYTQKVKKAFHISMAALDISTSSDVPSQVMCGFEGRNYLLCTLRKPDLLQVPLDLNFEVGDELSLAANGRGHVHLTGYLTDDLGDLEEEEDEDAEMEEEEVVEKQKKKNKKRNKETENGPPSKKSKISGSDDDGDDDEDDSDLDMKALLDKSLVETDEDDLTFTSDDEAEEEEEDDDDDDSEDLDDEDEESSMSEEENQSEAPPKKTKKSKQQNGLANNVQEKSEQQTTPKQKEKEKKKQQSETKSPLKGEPSPKKKTLQGGVQIEELREGQGSVAKPGKFVSVYYEGRLKQNNKLFDSTTKGSGFSFRLGSGEVIKGWDVGVVGMKAGGKRRIICPPAMAYGVKGSPPAIPANSHLVFEVELKKVR